MQKKEKTADAVSKREGGRMSYRIEYSGKPDRTVRTREELIVQLRNTEAGTVLDIRKLYKSGVSDSVMETYKKYIGEGGTDDT